MHRLLRQWPAGIIGLQDRRDLALAHAPYGVLDQPLFARELEIHRCRVLRRRRPSSAELRHAFLAERLSRLLCPVAPVVECDRLETEAADAADLIERALAMPIALGLRLSRSARRRSTSASSSPSETTWLTSPISRAWRAE